jgi:hypothetical protein
VNDKLTEALGRFLVLSASSLGYRPRLREGTYTFEDGTSRVPLPLRELDADTKVGRSNSISLGHPAITALVKQVLASPGEVTTTPPGRSLYEASISDGSRHMLEVEDVGARELGPEPSVDVLLGLLDWAVGERS